MSPARRQVWSTLRLMFAVWSSSVTIPRSRLRWHPRGKPTGSPTKRSRARQAARILTEIAAYGSVVDAIDASSSSITGRALIDSRCSSCSARPFESHRRNHQGRPAGGDCATLALRRPQPWLPAWLPATAEDNGVSERQRRYYWDIAHTHVRDSVAILCRAESPNWEDDCEDTGILKTFGCSGNIVVSTIVR